MSPMSPTSPCGVVPSVPKIPVWGRSPVSPTPPPRARPHCPRCPFVGRISLPRPLLFGDTLGTGWPGRWQAVPVPFIARSRWVGAGRRIRPGTEPGVTVTVTGVTATHGVQPRGEGGVAVIPPPPGMSLVPREMTARRWGLLALGAQRWVALSPVVSLCPQGCPFVPGGDLSSPSCQVVPKGDVPCPLLPMASLIPGAGPPWWGVSPVPEGMSPVPCPHKGCPCPLTSWGMSHVPCPHKECPCPLTP